MYVFAHIHTHTQCIFKRLLFFSKNWFSTRKYGISGHDPFRAEVANTWQIITWIQSVAQMAPTHLLSKPHVYEVPIVARFQRYINKISRTSQSNAGNQITINH